MTTTRAVPAARIVLALQLLAGSLAAQPATPPPAAPGVVAIRAGRLIDPATGSVAKDQIIIVRGKKFEAIGFGAG